MREKIKFDRKYIVIKVEDIQKYLEPEDIETLNEILHHISNFRKLFGKKDNTYLVINTDEPYAGLVAQILKDHGHYCQDESMGDVVEVEVSE